MNSPRYIDAHKIKLLNSLGEKDENGDLLISLRDVRNAIAQTPTEDVLALPCKPGDIVYIPWCWKDGRGIAVQKVVRLALWEKQTEFVTDMQSDDEEYLIEYSWFRAGDIGHRVFLTQKEAEKALAEGVLV